MVYYYTKAPKRNWPKKPKETYAQRAARDTVDVSEFFVDYDPHEDPRNLLNAKSDSPSTPTDEGKK